MKKILLITLSCIFNLNAQNTDKKIVSTKSNKYYNENIGNSYTFVNLNNGVVEKNLIDTKTKLPLTSPYIKVDRDKYMPQVSAIFESVLKSKNVAYKGTRSAAMITILRSGKISSIHMILNNNLKRIDAFAYEEMELKWKKLKLDPKYIEWDETSQFVQVVFPLNF